MRRYFLSPLVLITGLITSQAVFSVVVYFSDQALYQKISAIKDAGYLIVPNSFILPKLLNVPPAFYGALFFTLTAGAGTTLLTFILILIWRATDYSWLMCGLIFFLWAGLLAALNFNGLNIAISTAFIIIQLCTAIATLLLLPQEAGSKQILRFSFHCAVLVMILAVWFPYLKNDPFITFRDNILLGNSIGQKISNFYYKYTMYPAEVFKSLDQKLLKTCRLSFEDENLRQIIENKLREDDYLPVDLNVQPDLTIVEKGQDLLFVHSNEIVIDEPISNFISGSDKILTEFSRKCDNYSFFRKFTFISLIIGLPLSLYILVHAAMMLLFSIPVSVRKSFFISSFFCLILLAGIIIQVQADCPEKMASSEQSKLLVSDYWRYRTCALKSLAEENICVEPYLDKFSYHNLKYIPEKYWFARTLAACKDEETYKILLQYLDDSNPNIVCMALYSLGKRDEKRAINEIIDLTESSRHWYEQWYAYKALKRLGWNQKKSMQFR